jgi:GT2 family glycosyltransferase/glycosyltransferase involved in cell wall biosynthesis/Tfp pilus assembly protein PilF
MKKNVDIIIVVHNALNYLQRCIESVQKHTDNYNLIVVDNNSNQETKMYLKNLKNIQLISNQKNYGFGYANNQAFRKTDSKFVCFLNSDTIVTKNWLNNLIVDLEYNNAGIVGPVSNGVSSEVQKIDFSYNDNDSVIQNFAEKRYLEFKNKVVESNRLIGFCLLAKRETLEKSGCFDDRYKFNFEDDDLCLRTIEQGYKLYCSLGIFVYHYGGRSFKDRFKVETHNTTLEESKKLYIQKWYDTQRIRQIHEVKNRLSIIYVLDSDSPSGGVKVVFEHANRLRDRGHDAKIYCNKNQIKSKWFDVYAPIIYFSDYSEIPSCDIAIGTYFTTLSIVQKIDSLVKIHLCQGYEAHLYDRSKDNLLITTIENDYRRIKEKIVVSKWLKQIIDNEYQIDSNYISNGIDKYAFSFSKHERNKTPKILIVGNYNLEIKGIKIALEAAIKYSELNRASIVRLASEKTKFDEKFIFYDMSKMSQDEIARIYETCDITVCASYKVEGFSLPPLESMASGTPVVTTDNGGVNDYAINNENAIIVQPGNSKALQNAIELVLSNSTIYSRLVENGLKTANEYLWFKQIDLLEGLLDRLYKKQKALMKEQLSVCMIVKNEEQYLENCLESIKELANEIIIVDTGSTDETIRIAKKFGAKIYHFDWNDNFSDARNFALEKVTQPWTLILDADEIISSSDIDKVRTLVKNQNVAYSFITRNYVDSKNVEGIISCTGEYSNEEKDCIGWCRSEKVRLFQSVLGIKFEGHIHELVENSLNQLNIEVKNSDIPIHHFGCLKTNKKKQETYLKLSQIKAKTEDPKALYELALQYMSLTNYDEALVIWRKLLELEPNNCDYLAHTGTTFNLLNDYTQAEKYFLESIKISESEYTFKHLAICYAKQEKHEDAYRMFKKVVYSTNDLKTMADFAFCCNTLKKYDEAITILEKSMNINKRETLTWGLLEVAYNEKGIELTKRNRLPQAVSMFKSSISVNPRFDVARANLVQVNKLLSSTSFSKKFIRQ